MCGPIVAPLRWVDAGRGVSSFRGFLLVWDFVALLMVVDVWAVDVGPLVVCVDLVSLMGRAVVSAVSVVLLAVFVLAAPVGGSVVGSSLV